MVLSHLCYASGNTEPGLPQGTRDQAIQRVDNYAAGFLRAGARAVVAEGHFGPAYYVRSLLTSGLSIEKIWERSPSAHGNTFSVASSRSAGFTQRLDPDRPGGGFYRSLVSAGLDAPTVRAGAAGRANADGRWPTGPAEPRRARPGVRDARAAIPADRWHDVHVHAAAAQGRRRKAAEGRDGRRALGSDPARPAASTRTK